MTTAAAAAAAELPAAVEQTLQQSIEALRQALGPALAAHLQAAGNEQRPPLRATTDTASDPRVQALIETKRRGHETRLELAAEAAHAAEQVAARRLQAKEAEHQRLMKQHQQLQAYCHSLTQWAQSAAVHLQTLGDHQSQTLAHAFQALPAMDSCRPVSAALLCSATDDSAVLHAKPPQPPPSPSMIASARRQPQQDLPVESSPRLLSVRIARSLALTEARQLPASRDPVPLAPSSTTNNRAVAPSLVDSPSAVSWTSRNKDRGSPSAAGRPPSNAAPSARPSATADKKEAQQAAAQQSRDTVTTGAKKYTAAAQSKEASGLLGRAANTSSEGSSSSSSSSSSASSASRLKISQSQTRVRYRFSAKPVDSQAHAAEAPTQPVVLFSSPQKINSSSPTFERRSRRRSEVTPAEQTASHGQAPLQPKRLLTAPTESDAEKPRAKKSTPSAHPAPCVQVDAAQQENVQPMSALKASEVSPLRQDPLEEYRRDYKYKVVIRGALRKHMHGMTCPDCEKFFQTAGLSEEEIQKHVQSCSRHRVLSPPKNRRSDAEEEEFWNMSFPDTQKDPQQAHLRQRATDVDTRVVDRMAVAEAPAVEEQGSYDLSAEEADDRAADEEQPDLAADQLWATANDVEQDAAFMHGGTGESEPWLQAH